MDVARAASTMEGVTVTRPMSAEEYLATGDEERRTELIDGEVVTIEPDWTHQRTAFRIAYALETWIREAPGRGAVSIPLDVRIDDRNVFAPDLLWFAEGRVPSPGSLRPYPIPEIAVEVRSPSTWRYNVGPKKDHYERRGLNELWLVDAAADTILVFRRSTAGAPGFDVALELGSGEELRSPQLPGFSLAVDDLLAG